MKAAEFNMAIDIVFDSIASLKGADVIYTDVWVSMGEEALMKQRVEQLGAFKVTMEMLKT